MINNLSSMIGFRQNIAFRSLNKTLSNLLYGYIQLFYTPYYMVVNTDVANPPPRGGAENYQNYPKIQMTIIYFVQCVLKKDFREYELILLKKFPPSTRKYQLMPMNVDRHYWKNLNKKLPPLPKSDSIDAPLCRCPHSPVELSKRKLW